MFDEYAFLTATANTSLVHFDQYAEELSKRPALNSGDLVVDIGSNDGTLLKAFKRRGASVLGIEPARAQTNARIGARCRTRHARRWTRRLHRRLGR